MKSLNIILLCMMLLIQGISQSYAAQMMTAGATALPTTTMVDMPCHEVADDSAMTMNDCCDQDCQCHVMASAMAMNALIFAHGPSSGTVSYFKASFVSSALKSLYRPPIIA